MASEYPCDNEDGNLAVATITSHLDPSAAPQFLCQICMCIMGIELAKIIAPELLPVTEVVAPLKRDKRTVKGAEQEAEYDAARTIAEVVESAPRLDDGDIASSFVDAVNEQAAESGG